jgi:phospholipase C
VPPEASIGNVDTPVNADGTASALLGFRVPCLLIGPRASRGEVAREQYDANSILNMITWRFGLPGIGIRAATSRNLATALDFNGPPKLSLPPSVPLVNQVYGSACAANPMADLGHIDKTFAEHFADLDKVKNLMIEHNFRMS